MTATEITHSPKTLAETYALLADRHESCKIIAGGTDLMVLHNAQMLQSTGATEYIDIWGLDELRGITDEGERIRIGALATYTELINSPVVRHAIPPLVEASKTIGAIQIQNRGTIGGNIVNASPAGDTLPVLAVFDAEIELGSSRGQRLVDFNQFYTAYRETVLEPDELLLAVRVAKLRDGEKSFFYKAGTRRAQAISKVVIAARAYLKNGVIGSIKIGLGSVAATVIRARLTENLLINSLLNNELIEEARRTISMEIMPITDLRSTEHYRRTVTGNLLAEFLRQLI
ncbi:MAG: FAD binding domain-containing protein [Acidobacteria bacterium]|nr:FAD binding domain-containing protein [Acidobacteriota bacterium]